MSVTGEPLIAFQEVIAGLLVTLAGGIVAASHQFSKARRDIPPTFDWVDFVLLALSGWFSGFIGFLLASWQIDQFYPVLAIAGLSSIGGYNTLIAVKDIGLDALHKRLVDRTKENPPN